ncbi:MAG: 3'(2'),5'-bisphosphate nucleotidase CysQ [Hyphomicrobiaceae bacterium]
MKNLVAELELIACDAGRLIAEIRAKGIDVMAKGDGSPVTEADARAEALIIERLEQAWPGIPIVAEELASSEGSPEGIGGRFFLVDPLDGTKEFIKGTPDYTVNIALVDGGRPVAGVVMAPGRAEIYSGCDGRAHMAEVPGKGAPIERYDIRVRVPGETWTAVVSVSHMTEATRQFLDPLPLCERVSVGSSLKFCLLACGKADIYPRLGRTMQWDTAAGDAVLRAAGGSTVTRSGEELRYGPRAGLPENRFENPEFIAFAGPIEQLRKLVAA